MIQTFHNKFDYFGHINDSTLVKINDMIVKEHGSVENFFGFPLDIFQMKEILSSKAHRFDRQRNEIYQWLQTKQIRRTFDGTYDSGCLHFPEFLYTLDAYRSMPLFHALLNSIA